MLTIIIIVIGLSLLIIGHEAGHFFAAKLFKLKVDEFGFGFPPRMFARKKGETEYSVNWLPFGGFVKIAGEHDHMDTGGDNTPLTEEERGRVFNVQPAWRKSTIILAGVFMNFVLGWILLSFVFMIGTPPILVVSGAQENSPAALAGLKEGDIVKEYHTVESFTRYINDHRGKEIAFHVIRGSEEVPIAATPRLTVQENEGALGVLLSEGGQPRLSFFSALSEGLTSSLQILKLTFVGLYVMVKEIITQGSVAEGVVGPIGIFSVAERTSSIGIIYLFQLLSLISINLAVINLVPFPALDGGRFIMILVEKIKGSPISRRTETAINTVGFALLILLMVVVSIRDIVHLGQ